MHVNHDHHPTLVASQKWKLWLSGSMMGVAALGFLFNEKIAQLLEVSAFSVEVFALLLTFATLAAAFVSVRCPRCGLSLVKYSMSSQSTGEWLKWLLATEKCPRCSFSPSDELRIDRRSK